MDENEAWKDFSTRVDEDDRTLEEIKKSSASMVDMVNILGKTINDMSVKLDRTVKMADRVMGEDTLIDNLQSTPPQDNPFGNPEKEEADAGSPVPPGDAPGEGEEEEEDMPMDGSLMEEDPTDEEGEEGEDTEEDGLVEEDEDDGSLASELELYVDDFSGSDRATIEEAIRLLRSLDTEGDGEEDQTKSEEDGEPGPEPPFGKGSDDGSSDDGGKDKKEGEDSEDKDFPPAEDSDKGPDKEEKDDKEKDDMEDVKKSTCTGQNAGDEADISKSADMGAGSGSTCTDTPAEGTSGSDLNKSSDEGTVQGQSIPNPVPTPPAPAPQTSNPAPDPVPTPPAPAPQANPGVPAPTPNPEPAGTSSVQVHTSAPEPEVPKGHPSEEKSFDDEYNEFMAKKQGTRWC